MALGPPAPASSRRCWRAASLNCEGLPVGAIVTDAKDQRTIVQKHRADPAEDNGRLAVYTTAGRFAHTPANIASIASHGYKAACHCFRLIDGPISAAYEDNSHLW